MRLCLFVFIAVLALPSQSALAQEDIPGPSMEAVISLRDIGSPMISPDGSMVAFTVSSTDWENNRYDTEIWLSKQGEEPFQLTRTKDGSSTSPRWSSDGKWISFAATRGDKRQVFVIRAAGGEAQQVTHAPEGVNGYAWRPGHAQIAYTMTDAQSDEMKERSERLGEFAEEDAEFNMSHLWLVDVETDAWPAPREFPCPEVEEGEEEPECPKHPEATQLTEGRDFTVSGFTWSPDGSRLAVTHQPNPNLLSFMETDISVLDVASGEMEPLVEREGIDSNPIWSPDSEWIIFGTTDGNLTSNFYKNNLLMKISSEGGAVTRVADGFDENLGGLRWTPEGLFGVAWQKTSRRLIKINPESGETEIIDGLPRYIYSANFSKDGRTLALDAQTPSTQSEIYHFALGEAPVAVTNMTSQIDGWEIGSGEVISWASRDGAEIEGVLYKPADFDPEKKYPLLVAIHGGPTGIDYPVPIDSYVYPIPQWLAKGAVVLQPNYRGSAGYGEDFRSLNVRNLGVGDAWDVMTGVEHLVREGIADPDRMGAMGWSQGGYISAFLTTNTDRFKAISVGAGISNWVTYYVNTDIHPFTRQYLEATPWDDMDVYLKTSPMTNISQASTPTLIQHGEFDRRVPIPNAYELFQGLQDVGVETKLIVYKGFGHGINKPKERLAATLHNWEWFNRFVFGE